MQKENAPLETLNEIRQMMERSSRFISLSGWSGIAAGITALAGAGLARLRISLFRQHYGLDHQDTPVTAGAEPASAALVQELVYIAAGVLVVALIAAFGFTYIRSRKAGVLIWGASARRLLWNTLLPMFAGGVMVLRLLTLNHYLMIAPTCLIFYGLALVNASRYTLGEVRYLGYLQLLLGLISLWIPDYGLLFWAAGFGILHIIYGGWMWWKHERQ